MALPRETPQHGDVDDSACGPENDRIIEGRVNEGRFGYQVASDDEFVFASELFGRHGEATRIGGVFAYDVSNNRPEEVARFVGETFNRDDRLATASVSEARHVYLDRRLQGTVGSPRPAASMNLSCRTSVTELRIVSGVMRLVRLDTACANSRR